MKRKNMPICISANIYKLAFIMFALAASSFRGQKQSVGPKYFVGYSRGIPVFDSPKEKTLYIFRNGNTDVYCRYKPNRIILMVADTVLLFNEKAPGENKLIVKSGNTEKEYLLKTSLSFIATGNGSVFYTDLSDGNSINRIHNDSIVKTGISGQVIAIVDKNLYFSRTYDSLEVVSNADIFKVDVSFTKHPEKVVSNVSGEATFVLPNEEYVYERILYDGQFKPAVYSVKSKKYCLLQKINNKHINNTPYYSYKKNALAFYDKNSLEIEYVEIPKEYTISR